MTPIRRVLRLPGHWAIASRLLALALCFVVSGCQAKGSTSPRTHHTRIETAHDPADDRPPAPPERKLGLILNSPKACQGYTLLAPLNSSKSFLIDLQGKVVRTWNGFSIPNCGACLLPNGNLLRASQSKSRNTAAVKGAKPEDGGRIQEFTFDGELVWDFPFDDDKRLQHHDLVKLPTGNVLVLASDSKTAAEARAAGRVGGSGVGSDCIIEIKPTGKTTGEVVWSWYLWDHLVQDRDKTKPNYGNVRAHPELMDVNYQAGYFGNIAIDPKQVAKLRGLGYLGNVADPMASDWSHANAMDYNADLDQIVLSLPNFSEFWIIDHSTTVAQAAGHSGGRGGKGGDILYRWGNPAVYRAGTAKDQRLFALHNAHWIPKGSPGEGHVLVFNNGDNRPKGVYSSVDEIVPALDASGHYPASAASAFGPDKAIWSYHRPADGEFFSLLLSGAQRLPNGNTLICSGIIGYLFEVTPQKEVVWEYNDPVRGDWGPSIPGAKGYPGKLNFKAAWPQPPTGEMNADPPDGGSVFRAYRYGPDFPGFAGKDLTPGSTIEEMQSKASKKDDPRE